MRMERELHLFIQEHFQGCFFISPHQAKWTYFFSQLQIEFEGLVSTY
jgi:hypothetical protein